MIQRHRQTGQLLTEKARVQASLSKEGAEKAFKDVVAHHQRVEREDETKKMQERMEQLKEIKEIRFKPLVNPRKQKKLPTYSIDDIQRTGALDEQMRPAQPLRPQRARKRRKRR